MLEMRLEAARAARRAVRAASAPTPAVRAPGSQGLGFLRDQGTGDYSAKGAAGGPARRAPRHARHCRLSCRRDCAVRALVFSHESSCVVRDMLRSFPGRDHACACF